MFVHLHNIEVRKKKVWHEVTHFPILTIHIEIFSKLVRRKATSTNDFSVCPYFRMSVCPNTDFLVMIHKLYICMIMNIESTLGWPSVSIWIFYGISYFCSLFLSISLPSTLNLICLSIYLSICLSVAYFPTFYDLSHSLPPLSFLSTSALTNGSISARKRR